MEQYQKIQTVYFRDHKTNRLMEGKWTTPEFEYLKDNLWECTEKIDGTNIRIMWDGEQVRFGGKTNNANIPSFLYEVLQDTFTNEKMAECFPTMDNVCLYGEGYGRKIQKGGNYLPDSNNFILFDVKIDSWWLKRESLENIAQKLGIKIVPIIGEWTLPQAIEYVRNGFMSTIADNKDYEAEGLVLKPKVAFFNRKGERVITKIKHRDFRRLT